MGKILFAWNEYDDATKCFERARNIHIQKHGEMHLSVANSNFYLGCISGESTPFSNMYFNYFVSL